MTDHVQRQRQYMDCRECGALGRHTNTAGCIQAEPIDTYQAIIVSGNPVDGLSFIGPFATAHEANEYADRYYDGGSDWWVTDLDVPESDEDEDVPEGVTLPAMGLPFHKAEPNADDIACVHCGLDIARVPGGQGPTWIHTATGAVAGSGAPR